MSERNTYYISIPQDQGKKYESFRYPGGELQVRLLPDQLETIRGTVNAHVTAHIQNGDIMELALLTDALGNIEDHHWHYAHLHLPYLPYGRADRRFVEGDSFGLSAFGYMLSALMYDKVTTVDVHSRVAADHITNFENYPPEIYINRAANDIQKEYPENSDLTILLPDQGASRYKLDFIGLPIVQGNKVRDAGTGKLSGFVVPKIKTRNVLIVDDICDGGGTFVGLANAFPKGSPYRLFLYVTHGLFSKGYTNLFEHFTKIYTTDSILNRPHPADPEDTGRLVIY